MMVETLIERNNAILAKEKGFDWECLAILNVYEDDSSSIGTYELTRNSKLAKIQYALPSQSLLQKWLRDEYKLHIHIIPTDNDEGAKLVKWQYQYIYRFDDDLHDSAFVCFNDTEYDTYEQALEEALNAALEII